ncbi:dihydrolipoyl dehydrogenase [Actinocorallia lasiicapitis]
MANKGPYDIVVLGGGSGGYACAIRAAELGKRVALIEKDPQVGGTCLNRGCVPTKALLHAAEVADETKEAASLGVKATFDGIDGPAVLAYKNKIVNTTVKGLTGLIKSHGIEIIEGYGRVISPNAVQVGEDVYETANIVLATGSVPKSLPGLEIDGDRVISSDHALDMDRVPASVVILGGGVIGVEFASVWRSFGAEVTIVEGLPHLLPLEEESSSKRLERAFRKRGIKFELGVFFESVKTTDTGISVSLANGKTIDAELLLVAVGRGPVSQGLGFEEIGVQVDRGYVIVNEYCQTTVPGVYAVGDLIPTLQLAHVGFAEGILVAEKIAGLNPTPIDYDGVPRITYSNPEVASVGITSAKAKELGFEITEVTYDLAGNPKSKILGTQGEVKMIAQKDGPILGVHMVGARIGELVTEGQLLYNWEALPSEVAQLIHAHPTQSEAVGEAALALAGKPLHTHG